MASRAFTARLSRAAPSWWASTSTGHSPALPTAWTSIVSPNERCKNSTSAAMNLLGSSGFGSSGCCREKASSRCVSMAARCAPRMALSSERFNRDATPPVLGLMTPFGRRSQERAHRHAFPLILLRIEAREVLSDDLFGAITLDAFGSAVPSRDSSLRIEHEDRVVLDCLHQQLELLLAP